jgi:hypothetical protein
MIVHSDSSFADYKQNKSGYTTPLHTMTDAGDLQKLPLEIRKEIYAHLLVEPKKIGMKRYKEGKAGRPVRSDNHRQPEHRGKFYDRHQREWVAAPPCTTSLLFVNKAVSEEAAQVLYGYNEFEFEHAEALRCFLESIGKSQQYVRYIGIIDHGLLYFGSWRAMDRAVKLLQQANGLRSLEVSHFALCADFHGNNLSRSGARLPPVNTRTLAQHCLPFLRSLNAIFEKRDLRTSILDVIKITLPSCAIAGLSDPPSIWAHIHYGHGVCHQPWGSGIIPCKCHCKHTEEKNGEMARDLRNDIASQLGLIINQEESKETE